MGAPMPGVDLRDACRPVAMTDRSGYDESVHHGVVVVVDADGSELLAVGDPAVEIYPRSANKPLQADAMLANGLVLDEEELALACASHSGTDRHVAVVRRILAGAGLVETDLETTRDLPLDRDSADAHIRAGGSRDSIHMNCSGKHAAMLATCVANGWPTAGYLAADHPLQLAITSHLADLAGGVAHVGIDGCGAPAHVVGLRSLATAVAEVAGRRGPIWSAMTAHPELVGGEGRTVTDLMRAVPGMMAKDGAEGVFVAALPGSWSAAVKIADGNARAAGVTLAAALADIGVDIDPDDIAPAILGHGEPVGRVRSLIGNRT